MAEAPPAVVQRPAVPGRAETPSLPGARGPLSDAVLAALSGPPGPLSLPRPDVTDPVANDDLQLALYTCYELHYRSFAGVDERWEWDPHLLAVVAELEAVFETALRRTVAVEVVAPDAVESELRR